jgi:hypothetical protein
VRYVSSQKSLKDKLMIALKPLVNPSHNFWQN